MSQKDKLRFLVSNNKSNNSHTANTLRPNLIDTKIDIKVNCPPPLSNPVNRPRLLEKLDKGLSRKITLITAPAGYGKSTLLADWALTKNIPVAWLTLEQEDNDVVKFWSYFFYAFKDIYPHIDKHSREYLLTSGPLQINKVLSIFINELNRIKKETIIILDDFHLIDDQNILVSFNFLLNHLPERFHIYLLGRSYPTFLSPVSLRAKGLLEEITTDELRFTPSETENYFKMNLHYALPRQELSSLNLHLEGWVAGMQMVLFLLSNSTDKYRFFRLFKGNHHHMTEYFSQEILNRQPQEIRDFLLQTSVLLQMNGSLCNTLTNKSNGQEMLEKLEQLQLFIFPLDEQMHWYRYHPLFAETLRSLLQKKDPDHYTQLHQLASTWFHEQGLNGEAIYHALEAHDYETAAAQLEQEAPRLFKHGELSKLIQWVCALPKENLYERPVIAIYYSWGLIITGKLEDASSTCAEILEFTKDENKTSLMKDQSSLDFLKSEIDIMRNCLAVYQGKPHAPEEYTKALQKMQEGSLYKGGLVNFNICSADLLQSIPGMHGKLKYADHFFSTTEPEVRKLKETLNDFTSFSFGYTVLSQVKYEQNKLDEAHHYVNTALQLNQKRADWGILLPAYIVLTKIETARGNFHIPMEIWNRLEHKIEKIDWSYWVSVFYAHKTRMAIKRNQCHEVKKWMKVCEFSSQDEITILQHYQFITLVRALLYLENFRDALSLAERIGVLLEEEGGIGQQIEASILQALCKQALNLPQSALTNLERALIKGAGEGYRRTFIDEGINLWQLMERFKIRQLQLPSDKNRRNILQYNEMLMQDISQENHSSETCFPEDRSTKIDALTLREREVLKLVAKGHSNRHIAEALFISVSTVKTHIHNICRKLNVNSRTKAIALANELNLLQ